MFTIEQIKEAHSRVKSGADFPAYVQALIRLGVVSYTNYVKDGTTIYSGKNNYSIESGPKYPEMQVAPNGAVEQFKSFLKAHQEGKSDYSTFCKQAAETGVEKWTTDTVNLTCTYYDKAGNKLLMEEIRHDTH